VNMIFENEIRLGGRMKDETINRIRKFSEDRDWEQFHTPANLAKSISIEANELLECFQWSDTDYDLVHVKEELADVLVYCRNMLDKLGLDEDEIVNSKMYQNEVKYPVAKAKGKADKYDRP
jgi:NTP pyrophosphatase (non-canonical NTP hydrolase)